jgi:beta-lactamase class A
LVFASVYFRDLDAGPTMGINEHTDYIPASLLKVPLVLTYLDLSESDPGLLGQKIPYGSGVAERVPNQTFKPSTLLREGALYTVKELIEHAIVNSDNVAAELLYEHLDTLGGKALLSETYRNLGIIEMGSDLDKEAVNTKSYGSIMRMLYNASYLNQENSELFLKLLSESEFKDGLRAGVPESITVAHKFGERFAEDGRKQLHDCGIVYFPRNPYLLCVMTKGSDFGKLAAVIKTISSEVYKEVDSRRIKK